MSPAPICGIYHKPRNEEFTENWRHESQTSKPRYSASRCLSEITKHQQPLACAQRKDKNAGIKPPSFRILENRVLGRLRIRGAE